MDEGYSSRPYAEVLRAIGMQIDADGLQDVAVCEVLDGYIARAGRGDGTAPVGLAFGFTELATMIEALPAEWPASGEPSYQNLLGGLGRELDAAGAQMVTVVELSFGLLVTFYPLGYRAMGCYGERYEFVFRPESLGALLARPAS